MSYCLKTGGILYDATYDTYHVSDLHIEGDCVIAVINDAMPPDTPAFDGHITLRVTDPNAFRRKPTDDEFGIVVARQAECVATKYLQEHIAKWYPGKALQFNNE